jgi:hypothetical protein
MSCQHHGLMPARHHHGSKKTSIIKGLDWRAREDSNP